MRPRQKWTQPKIGIKERDVFKQPWSPLDERRIGLRSSRRQGDGSRSVSRLTERILGWLFIFLRTQSRRPDRRIQEHEIPSPMEKGNS
jgi:hypothetical protein